MRPIVVALKYFLFLMSYILHIDLDFILDTYSLVGCAFYDEVLLYLHCPLLNIGKLSIPILS